MYYVLHLYCVYCVHNVLDMNSMKLNWLEAAGIKKTQIIADNIVFANTLYVPECGLCGRPYIRQLHWFRDINMPPLQTLKKDKPIILYIERQHSRNVINSHEVINTIKSFATKYSYDVIIHSDHNLPSHNEQIIRFAKADIVLGPHGAGQLFTLFSPLHVCIIEFHRVNEMNDCYGRLAYMMNFNYISTPMVIRDIIDTNTATTFLLQCHEKVASVTKL